MPVVLIGAGLAWFLMGRDAMASMGNGFHPGSHGYDPASGMSRTGGHFGDAASKSGDAMQDAFGSVRQAAESAGSAVSDTAQKISDTASSCEIPRCCR